MERTNLFAGNPLIPGKRSKIDPSVLEFLFLKDEAVRAKGGARLLPLFDGGPLVVASRSPEGVVVWSLCWQSLERFGRDFHISLSSLSAEESVTVTEDELVERKYDKLVYLGEKDGVPFFAIDVTGTLDDSGPDSRAAADKVAQEVAALFSPGNSSEKCAFIDLRTLMVAADVGNKRATEEVAIGGHVCEPHPNSCVIEALIVGNRLLVKELRVCFDKSPRLSKPDFGQARALLEWHKQSRFCGWCGSKTLAMEAGQRRQCCNSVCKNKLYPRIDSVVIMLVIDKDRDCVILGRQARFIPRMWSCLAGFIETGENLEEAVRRETREEVGIDVGQIIYHSSQPWPVGPSSMPGQLMVGFFAYATSFEVKVDGEELQDAQWFNRESVRKALTCTDYRNAQEAASLKIYQLCTGEKAAKDPFSDQSSPMFLPGPYAIAHSLIATWANATPDSLLSKV